MAPRGRRKRRSSEGAGGEEEESPASSRQRVVEDDDEEEVQAEATTAQDEEMAPDATATAQEEEERMAPQSPLAGRVKNAPGKPPEAGVIQRVYVENFMCHRKLTVDLCRNVNFIHGQNGSGKSAVLAAIQICLGAGARRTHRARNLKELVRKESTAQNISGAKVRVTLLNKGEDGFQHDTYGDTITVERSISLHGGYNGYKLLDSNMKEQSRSKKDLDAMLDQLNIQVENPVAVLDQEEAKKFLTGKPQDKYNFFMKATELERIDRSYASAIENIHDLRDKEERLQRNMAGSVENVRQLKHEWEQFQELQKLEDKLQDCRLDLAWAMYKDENDDVITIETKIQRNAEKLEKKKQDVAKAEEAASQDDAHEDELKTKMQELTEEANSAAREKTSLETELKRTQAPLKAKRRELQQLETEQSRASERLQAAKRQLQEAREEIMRAAGNAESEMARCTELLQNAEKELEEERAKLPQLKQTSSTSCQKYEEMETPLHQAKETTSRAERALMAVNHKIRELSDASGGNSMAMFGQRVGKVYAMVQKFQKQRKFKGPVIGPIGHYIKVAPGKDQYAPLAELAVGGMSTLDRFIVTNPQDRATFMNIRKNAGCTARECNVYKVNVCDRFNVPSPPVSGIETVASALSVENDIVFNALVDFCNIDQIALAPNFHDSESSLLEERSNGQFAVKGGNIRKAYSLPRGDLWQVNKGVKQIISNERKLKQTIGVDKTAALAEAKGEVPALKQELEDARTHEQEIARERKQHKIEWNQAQKTTRGVEKKIQQLEYQIQELRADAEQAENTEIDTTEYEEDISNAEQALQSFQEQKQALEQEIKEIEPTIDTVTDRLEEVRTRNEKVILDLEQAEGELEEYYQNLSQRQDLLEKRRAKLEHFQQVAAELEEKLAEATARRADVLLKARKFTWDKKKREEEAAAAEHDGEGGTMTMSPDVTQTPTDEELEEIEPVCAPKSQEFYQLKIEKAKKKILREKERRQMVEGDAEVAYEKYMRARNDLQGKLDAVEGIRTNIDNLTKDIHNRQKRWRQFREFIVNMTNITFDEMLNKKGSSGQLAFNHESGSLDLVVQKDNKDQSSQTADVKALSGGERSFTTLSLLLALGEQLETPFRVMDEFDVFLDPIARKIALKTLIETAKSMEHRQFIFITPQDLSNIETDPRLKIFGMKPPSRSQTVGGPTQQTLDFSQ